MTENPYISAFKRMLAKLDPICMKYHKSKLYFILDALKAHIRYGVTPNQYIGFGFYKLSSLERKQFYTARFQGRYDQIFNPPEVASIFDRKEKTLQVFDNFIHRDWLDASEANLGEIIKFLDTHEKIIVKPCNLSSGRGIHVYGGESPEYLKNNGFLLEEFINQHPSISKLNPSSVNTIRIYTLNRANKLPLWIMAMIRVGGYNAEVDNYHAGGVGYPINIEKGIVSGCGYDINGNSYLFHPGSGIQTVGFAIPNWQLLTEYVNGLCTVVPEARLIAWDIAILQEGFDLVEANVNGDSGLMQSIDKEGKRHQIMENL